MTTPDPTDGIRPPAGPKWEYPDPSMVFSVTRAALKQGDFGAILARAMCLVAQIAEDLHAQSVHLRSIAEELTELNDNGFPTVLGLAGELFDQASEARSKGNIEQVAKLQTIADSIIDVVSLVQAATGRRQMR